MTNTKKLFELAQLAEASYANFWNPATNTVITTQRGTVDALIASGFSQSQSDPTVSTQATEFTQHWRVVSHQPNTASGFSATLFQRIDDDPIAGFQAGQYVYAIRGTEPEWLINSADLSTDIGDIVVDGLALDQIVDMYNHWHRLQAWQGQPYLAAKLETLIAETEQRANGEANFTDQYLADRAKMLGWAKQLNAEDKDYGLIVDHDNEWTFSDVGSGYQFTIGSGIPLYQLLADQHRIAFGSDDTLEPDTLSGDEARDHLYGMAGDDTLIGGEGGDYLEGGTGDDSLQGDDVLFGNEDSDVLYGGDGRDVILGQAGNDVFYWEAA